MTTTDRSPRARRSQAERRAETRARLIEATITSLVEDGWAGTSTRSVARRAGVSQGAQQHHFPTKRTLVEAALTDIVTRLVEASATWSPPPEEDARAAFLLDRLWEIHCMPVGLAVQEMLTLARTDADTGQVIGPLTQEAERLTVETVAGMLPVAARQPEFAAWVRTSVATMRGLVMVTTTDAPDRSDLWPGARAVLLRGMPR